MDIRIQSVTMVKTCFEFNTKKGIEAKKKKKIGGKVEKALLPINEQCSIWKNNGKRKK